MEPLLWFLGFVVSVFLVFFYFYFFYRIIESPNIKLKIGKIAPGIERKRKFRAKSTTSKIPF